MRKKLTLLFALLCASVMGWAVQYCGETITTTDGVHKAVLTCTNPSANTYVMTITSDDANFTGLSGDNMYCYINGDNTNYHMTDNYSWNAGTKTGTFTIASTAVPVMHTPLYLDMSGEITFTTIQNQTFEWPATCGGGSTPESATINWTSISWVANSGNKYKVSTISGMNVVEVQKPNFAAERGIYMTFPSDIGLSCSLDGKYATQGAGMVIYLSAFVKQETEVTVTSNGVNYTFTVYYEDGEPDDLTGWNIAKGKTSVSGYDVNNTDKTHIAANDGDKNSRWSSEGGIHYPTAGAQDWWYVDLGDFYSVETIKILFEGAFPNDYDLMVSNNAVSWTIIGTYTTNPKVGNTNADYNEYDFSASPYICRYIKIFARNGANINWGISIWEFEVYGDHASINDHNPPTMTSASLSGDPSYDRVNIAVAGTDEEDGAVASFHVVDATHGVDQVQAAETGVITVTGLNAETSYTFTITALDAAGNESANSVNVAATTAQDTSIPLVAAPVPSGTGKEILPVYCDAFASILEHEFDKDGFAGPTLMMEQNISGDHSLVYNVAGANEITWGHYNGSNDEICAQSAYRGSGMGVDASAMEYLHIDIWSLQAGTNVININVNDAALTSLRLSHSGNGWQSYDIAMSDFGFNPENPAYSSDNVRWMKFNGIGFISGKMALDNVYFWKTATGLHTVSATANNASFGTASVIVTETGLAPEGGMVTDGTEVTFSATPNDGYIFVNWSNGNTNATFNATVDAAMNLTANFRALNHICCNEEMTNGDYTVYVTYKKTANDNEYVLIVRSAKEMINFNNAFVGHINGNDQINMNGQGVLSGNGHMLSYTFTSTTEPKMNTPLYINFAGHGEVTFNQIDNFTVFEFSQPCADPEITAIELNKTEATLDMGNTLTLVPTFTPAYMSADITWQTSSDAVATVSNGVVTPVAPGSATITAKVTESIKATCSVTVQEAAAHNWYGYGTDKDLDYTYRIEYTTDHHIVAHVKRQGNKEGLVDVGMNINNNWTTIDVTEGEEEGWNKGTTEATFTAGDNIHIIFQSNFAGASSIIGFDYTVGSDNVMPTIVPSTLVLSNSSMSMSIEDADVQLTAEIHHRDAANMTIIWTSDDETVVTVENGLVHPVGVGTTTIHAATFNEISATCEVTITGSLVPTTWYGYGTFTPQEGLTGFTYSITRNVDHSLTYKIVLDRDPVGFVGEVNIKDDGVYSGMTYTSSTRTATFTTAANYALDGDVLNKSFWWLKSADNADRVEFTYTVGSENDPLPQAVAVDEEKDNSAILTTYDGQTVVGVLGRSFTADNLYTLVLPFDVDAAQTAEKLPGQLTKLSNTIVKDNGDLRINFVDAEAVEAGVPYLYTPSADVTNPVFTGVTVSKDLKPTVPADRYAEYHGIYAPTTGAELKAHDNAYVLGSDQYLYAASVLRDEQPMKALRGYFVLDFSTSGANAPRARVIFNNKETETATGISDVQSENVQCTKLIRDGQLLIIKGNRTYNAQGQLIK